MKIKQPGYNAADWRAEIICKLNYDDGCGAVLEVDLDDLFVVHLHDIGGARTNAVCRCLGCGRVIEIGGVTDFHPTLPTLEEW